MEILNLNTQLCDINMSSCEEKEVNFLKLMHTILGFTASSYFLVSDGIRVELSVLYVYIYIRGWYREATRNFASLITPTFS